MKTKSLFNVYMEYTHCANEELAKVELNSIIHKIMNDRIEVEKQLHPIKPNGLIDGEMEDGTIEEVTPQESDMAIQSRYSKYANGGIELIVTYKDFFIEGLAKYMGLECAILNQEKQPKMDELIKTYGQNFIIVYEDKENYTIQNGKNKGSIGTRTIRKFATIENGQYDNNDLKGKLVMLANGKGMRFPKKFIAILH